MFKIDSIVDQAAKATKSPLMYIDNKDVRTNLETLVDTSADFTKTVYNTSLELSKQMMEAAKNVDYSKFFAVAK
jgi:hypothetical protein